MKTVLLALVLIGATLALLALTHRGEGDEALLEPRARSKTIALAPPETELVPPDPLSPPGLTQAEDHAPATTREAVPRQAESPVRLLGLQSYDLAPGQEIRMVDMIQKGRTVNVSGRFIVSGQTLRTFEALNSVVKRPDGTWVEHYDEGKPKVQGQIRNGREVGLWIYWHENGERSAEGRYVNGERHGLWTSWHADGSKESEGLYSYGEREGSWIDFHPGGTKQQVATYVNGELEGRIVRWHVIGAKESEGFCIGGDLDGPWRGWYPNGTTSSHGDYKYGQRVGRWSFLDPDGEPDASRSGRYENGEKVAD